MNMCYYLVRSCKDRLGVPSLVVPISDAICARYPGTILSLLLAYRHGNERLITNWASGALDLVKECCQDFCCSYPNSTLEGLTDKMYRPPATSVSV